MRQIISNPKPSSAKNVFIFSKNSVYILKCKIEKASFLEEFNSRVMLSTLKYLVCFLGTELKKLTLGSEESLTSKRFSELKGLKLRFEVMECVRSHIQNLSLLLKNNKNETQFTYLCVRNSLK